ncbi:MAG: PAS domain S-box protein, partial [Pseudomonadota bacterium]
MSFRLKTILGIALIESVLLLVLVLSSLDFLRTSNEEQLVQRATTTSQLFTSAIKNAVLATDLATLESSVSDILTNSEVVYVRIYGGDQLLAQGGDKTLLYGQRTPDINLETVDDGVYDVTAQIEEGGIVFGHIELGLSTRSIQGVLDKAQQWVTGIAVLEVVLVAIFSWVLGTYLTRYLSQLRAASKVITETGPGHQLEIKGKDEIAEVAKAFNQMSASLAQTYTELRESIASREETLVTLERNRAKGEAILSSSLDAIITIDQQGNTIDYSEAAEQIFGWEYDEIVGRNMAEFIIPPEMRDAHAKGMQHYLDTGEGPVLGSRIQLEAMHKQGHRFPVEVAICPIDTPDGKLFTAFLRDISQQLESEIELRLIGRAFQTSEAMFITDTRASIIRVNEAFTQISGYQEDELLGNKPSLWASGSHDTEFYKDMWDSLIEKGEWKGEILNRRKSGEIIPEYLHISGVRDREGSVTHYVSHLIDISEQKANEQRLLDAIYQAQQAD